MVGCRVQQQQQKKRNKKWKTLTQVPPSSYVQKTNVHSRSPTHRRGEREQERRETRRGEQRLRQTGERPVQEIHISYHTGSPSPTPPAPRTADGPSRTHSALRSVDLEQLHLKPESRVGWDDGWESAGAVCLESARRTRTQRETRGVGRIQCVRVGCVSDNVEIECSRAEKTYIVRGRNQNGLLAQ